MKIILCTVLFFLVCTLQAQKIKAVIKDNTTNELVAFAGITNINTKATVISNQQGVFTINAKNQQVISIAAVGYNFDTLNIIEELLNKEMFVIYIKPLSRKLPDVIVKSNQYNSYQLDSMERRKDFFSTTSEHTQPVASLANSGAGIGINLNHFYKDERKKRAAINFFSEIEKDQYINYRFSPQLINKYTSLNEEATLLFMQQYRPSYDWLRKHLHEEDLLYYINDKLKAFLKN
jgi:hypothetical protein